MFSPQRICARKNAFIRPVYSSIQREFLFYLLSVSIIYIKLEFSLHEEYFISRSAFSIVPRYILFDVSNSIIKCYVNEDLCDGTMKRKQMSYAVSELTLRYLSFKYNKAAYSEDALLLYIFNLPWPRNYPRNKQLTHMSFLHFALDRRMQYHASWEIVLECCLAWSVEPCLGRGSDVLSVTRSDRAWYSWVLGLGHRNYTSSARANVFLASGNWHLFPPHQNVEVNSRVT